MIDLRDLQVNVDEARGTDEREVLPEGWYNAVPIGAEKKPTIKGDAYKLEYQFEIIDEGKFKGRYVWLNLNLWNPNPKTVEIAKEQLAELGKSCGLNGVLTDSSQVYMRPCMIKIRHEMYEGNTQVRIKGFKLADMRNQSVPSQNATPAPF